MEKECDATRFVTVLAAKHRVIMLGGLAVIAYGFSRPTKDSDIWLEPGESVESWFTSVSDVLSDFPRASIFAFSRRANVTVDEAIEEVSKFGVIRIVGLGLPVDIFRRPNECEEEDFEGFWEKSTRLTDGTWLPDPIDLYLTKVNTGRESDLRDQQFLEDVIDSQLAENLPKCGLDEARSLLSRFSNPSALGHALKNPDPAVQQFALEKLREFEAEGDPFSRDILAEWAARNPG